GVAPGGDFSKLPFGVVVRHLESTIVEKAQQRVLLTHAVTERRAEQPALVPDVFVRGLDERKKSSRCARKCRSRSVLRTSGSLFFHARSSRNMTMMRASASRATTSWVAIAASQCLVLAWLQHPTSCLTPRSERTSSIGARSFGGR